MENKRIIWGPHSLTGRLEVSFRSLKVLESSKIFQRVKKLNFFESSEDCDWTQVQKDPTIGLQFGRYQGNEKWKLSYIEFVVESRSPRSIILNLLKSDR